MDSFFRSAQFAFDVAAPVESTGAPFDHRHFLRPVTPSATHEVASVHTYGRIVALSTVRTLYAQTRIPLAETRRRLQEDQIFGRGRFVFGVVRFQLETVPGSFTPQATGVR